MGENEVGKMRKDCEEINIQHESVLTNLKRKHQDAIQEMTEQIDQLTKMKGKIDKDKNKIQHEIADARAATDEVGRARASAEKNNKNLITQLNDLNKKIEEANMTLGDFEGMKRKVAAENGDLLRGAGDVNNNMVMIQKANSALVTSLDEAKRVADDEARERHLLLGKYRNIEHELDGVKDNLEHANANNQDTQRSIKKYQQQIRDAQGKLEEESRQKSAARDNLVTAERRANSMSNALEEARTLLEQADRNRRTMEQELADVNETLSDATVTNQAIAAAKRKLESEMQTLHAELDEMTAEARLCEEKAAKSMIDAARLADELRSEQDLAQNLERDRKLLEAQVKDLHSRCDEAETNALKGGKKAMNKMETRIRELESETDAENRRLADSSRSRLLLSSGPVAVAPLLDPSKHPESENGRCTITLNSTIVHCLSRNI